MFRKDGPHSRQARPPVMPFVTGRQQQPSNLTSLPSAKDAISRRGRPPLFSTSARKKSPAHVAGPTSMVRRRVSISRQTESAVRNRFVSEMNYFFAAAVMPFLFSF